MPTRAPLPSPIATSSSAIVALSEDEALLRALMATMLEHAAIVTCSSIDRFIDQLAANEAEVALIDAASLPPAVGAFTQRLRQQFPSLLIVLTGSAALHTELRTQIADGTIFRFAPRPAAAQRLKIFLNGALHRSRQEQAALTASELGAPRSTPGEPDLRGSAAPRRTAGWLQRLRWHS